jgi:hypothetical protein
VGWYYSHGTKNQTWKEFIFSRFDRPDHKIEQCSIKGSVAYLACRTTKPEMVYGLVLLLQTQDGLKGYKPIEEFAGPLDSDAPVSLIKRLSPTTSEWALEWRKRCIERARRPKIKEGDVIELPTEIEWMFCGKRHSARVFEAIRLPDVRGLVFKSADGGLVKLRNMKNREFRKLVKNGS